MLASDIRRRFIDFFKKHPAYPHAEISSASLIPENDPTVLFTTAGMHPLVPFLMGETHPAGKRLVDAQKCVRTDDIDEVGDHSHLTFFEMMGNWSLGDYFKEGAISMSFAFLTSPIAKGGLGMDPQKLYVTVFAGDNDAPRDEESIEHWKKQFAGVGMKAEMGEDIDDGGRIFTYPKAKNWWGPAGKTGPCGPDTEMFYDTGRTHDKKFGAHCHPNCDCGRFVEIWNDVFMQYFKKEDGTYEPLKQQNVDTGLGLERVSAILEGKPTHYETELFAGAMEKIRSLATAQDIVSERIIADHLRAATFILGDQRGVVPSNTDQGYVLRRLIRRAIRHGKKIGITATFTSMIAKIYIDLYGEFYPELKRHEKRIIDALNDEEARFGKTLVKGEKEFERLLPKMQADKMVSGALAFDLYETYGFPLEMTIELAKEHNLEVDEHEFMHALENHQKESRAGAQQKFAGGLADHSEESTMLHTATHLLHQALRTVLGNHVEQRGSNITRERLRFDFCHTQKMTPEEIKKAEDLVNLQIQRDLSVSWSEMRVEEAHKQNAIGLFPDRYDEVVKVYTMGDFSKEICGGPHVEHTGVLKGFKILKEEACSAGIRRIKAVVEGLKK